MSQLGTGYPLQGGGLYNPPDFQRALVGVSKQNSPFSPQPTIQPTIQPASQQPSGSSLTPDQYRQSAANPVNQKNPVNNSLKPAPKTESTWNQAIFDYILLGGVAGMTAGFSLGKLFKKPSADQSAPIAKLGKMIDKPFNLFMRKPAAALGTVDKPHISDPDAIIRVMEEKHIATTFNLVKKRVDYHLKSGNHLRPLFQNFLGSIKNANQGIPAVNLLDHSVANQKHLKSLGFYNLDKMHEVLEGNPSKGIVGQISLLKEKIISLERNKAVNQKAILQHKALLKTLKGLKNHLGGEQSYKTLFTSLAQLDAQMYKEGVRAPGRFVARSLYYVKHLFDADALGMPGMDMSRMQGVKSKIPFVMRRLLPFMSLGAAFAGFFTFGMAIHDARKAQTGDKTPTFAHSFWGGGLGNFLGLVVGAKVLRGVNLGGKLFGKHALKSIPLIPGVLEITAGGFAMQLLAAFGIGELFQKTFEYASDKIFGKPKPVDQDNQQEQTEAAEHAAKVSPAMVANAAPKYY